GISNFAQLTTQNYVYVDKTWYLELFERRQEKFVVYLRPRRFGKSLFVSVLEHYYDINRKAEFEQLFSQYYIGQNPTSLANSYRILFFNFSGINTTTAQKSYEGFLSKVKEALQIFQRYYARFSEAELREIYVQDSPEKMLSQFFTFYVGDKIPIYLLIDEYDHFTNEILVRSLEEFKQTVSQNGYVRKFYEVIKNATQQGIVDRFFITG
ncbi:MAG: AAA family ATPase, partial [Raineya sp.]|nr:AAA family ATPase [Raineya sp.]